MEFRTRMQLWLDIFFLALRTSMGLVILIPAALTKIMHPFNFLSDVYSYGIMGPRSGVFLSSILPYAELIIGLSLVFGIFLYGSLLFAASLYLIFIIAQSIALYYSLHIRCGCWNEAEDVSYVTVLRTCCLLLVTIIMFIYIKSNNEKAALFKLHI